MATRMVVAGSTRSTRSTPPAAQRDEVAGACPRGRADGMDVGAAACVVVRGGMGDVERDDAELLPNRPRRRYD